MFFNIDLLSLSYTLSFRVEFPAFCAFQIIALFSPLKPSIKVFTVNYRQVSLGILLFVLQLDAGFFFLN